MPLRAQSAEASLLRPRVEINHAACFSCGACIAVCAPDSLFLENQNLRIDHATCTRCGRCHEVCPVHAVALQSAPDAPYRP